MTQVNPHLGRKHAIGFGIEATPGTPVAPQVWLAWMSNDFQPKTTLVENESALGVVEKVNDSEVSESWAEGKIGGKVSDVSIGFLLLGIFGAVTSVSNGDGTYTHTYSLVQDSTGTTQTITRLNPARTQRHARGILDDLELSAEAGAYVMGETTAKAWAGVNSSDLAAVLDEVELTSKHVTLDLADDLAGLSNPTARLSARSIKHTFERKSDAFFPLGSTSNPEFDRLEFEAKSEMVLRFGKTEMEDDYLSNKRHAARTTMLNDYFKLEVIGTKVRFREYDAPAERDDIVTQTINSYYEFDRVAGRAVQVKLTNKRASYVAA